LRLKEACSQRDRPDRIRPGDDRTAAPVMALDRYREGEAQK